MSVRKRVWLCEGCGELQVTAQCDDWACEACIAEVGAMFEAEDQGQELAAQGEE